MNNHLKMLKKKNLTNNANGSGGGGISESHCVLHNAGISSCLVLSGISKLEGWGDYIKKNAIVGPLE